METRSTCSLRRLPIILQLVLVLVLPGHHTARRVVAKVEFHFGELFPRVSFIVTNLTTASRAVVRFCNKRGTAEVRPGELTPAPLRG
jgi:hypothetical protein